MSTATSPLRSVLLRPGTIALGTKSEGIDCSAYRSLVIYFASVGTTSGGKVIIEEADWKDGDSVYTGTWSQIAEIDVSTFSGDEQYAYHFPSPDIAYAFVRARVSDAITGG